MSTPLAPDAIAALPLLDAAACAAVLGAVHQLRPAWTARHPEAPFYTLGAASYLDASVPARYAGLASRLNPVLDAAFGGLYAIVCAALAARLGEPVELASGQARPGFHVFLAHEAFNEPVAMVHVDMQDQSLDWEPTAPDATLSFTLPVALPAGGGGMDLWDVGAEAWLAMSPRERLAALPSWPRRFYPYAVGVMALHTGRTLHRIAATPGITAGDERVTLQGHGVRIGGVWRLYW